MGELLPHRARFDSGTTFHSQNEQSQYVDSKSEPKANDTLSHPHSPSTDRDPDAPPDGGYGWMVVLGVFLINFHVWGVNSVFGVFLAYFLSHNYYPGATHLQYAFVGGLSIGAAYLTAPLVTLSIHRLGTKATLTIGLVLETVALITAGSATEIWQLFLSLGVAFGFGMGFLFIGSLGIVPQWFERRRSLANGIATSGSGIGAVTYNLAVQAIIQRWGVPWAFRILGICVFAAQTFSTIIVYDRNKQVGARTGAIFDVKLLKKPEYLFFLGWGMCSILGYVVLLFTLPSYATTIGLTASQGSIISALLNVGQSVGRPPIGYFSDRIGRINMAAIMTFMVGVFTLALWIPAKSYGVLIAFALLGGSVVGTFFATLAPVTAEVVGLPSVPPAISIMWLFLVAPATFSEAIALEIAEATPSRYLGTQVLTAMMFIGAAICLLPVRAWKILENLKAQEEKEVVPGSEDNLSDQDRTLRKVGYLRAAVMWKRV